MAGIGAWGSGGFGSSTWGGFSFAGLVLASVLAPAENVIRLQFSQSVLFTGLLDPNDASRPEFYTVTNVPGTFGRNGDESAPVTVIAVALSPLDNFTGTILDLTLDRNLTPAPAQYNVSLSPLIQSADMASFIDSLSATNIPFLGNHKLLEVPSVEQPNSATDIANPSTLAALQQVSPIVNTTTSASLGVFVVDDSGDYATDAGLISLKKRIFRRIITEKGAFAHLPDYGLGVQKYSKKLMTAAVRESIATEAQKQIAKEPEIDKVLVRVLAVGTDGLLRIEIRIRTKTGLVSKFNGNFQLHLPTTLRE